MNCEHTGIAVFSGCNVFLYKFSGGIGTTGYCTIEPKELVGFVGPTSTLRRLGADDSVTPVLSLRRLGADDSVTPVLSLRRLGLSMSVLRGVVDFVFLPRVVFMGNKIESKLFPLNKNYTFKSTLHRILSSLIIQ